MDNLAIASSCDARVGHLRVCSFLPHDIQSQGLIVCPCVPKHFKQLLTSATLGDAITHAIGWFSCYVSHGGFSACSGSDLTHVTN